MQSGKSIRGYYSDLAYAGRFRGFLAVCCHHHGMVGGYRVSCTVQDTINGKTMTAWPECREVPRIAAPCSQRRSQQRTLTLIRLTWLSDFSTTIVRCPVVGSLNFVSVLALPFPLLHSN